MYLSKDYLKTADPYGGFLLWGSYWMPDQKAPDPEMPGLKKHSVVFLPATPKSICLCGSGQTYHECCRLKREWQPICHNPGAESFSLIVSQRALFKHVDGPKLQERLWDDPRLNCVEDKPKQGFWILWGDPAIETEFGVICFGDIELKNKKSLLVTAMSDIRMQTLLDLLNEIAADCLDEPKVKKDKPHTLRKSPFKK